MLPALVLPALVLVGLMGEGDILKTEPFDISRIRFQQQLASIDDFLRLRVSVGLTARPRAAAEKGLPNNLYGVTAYCDGQAVGMATVVGDGGLNFEMILKL